MMQPITVISCWSSIPMKIVVMSLLTAGFSPLLFQESAVKAEAHLLNVVVHLQYLVCLTFCCFTTTPHTYLFTKFVYLK